MHSSNPSQYEYGAKLMTWTDAIEGATAAVHADLIALLMAAANCHGVDGSTDAATPTPTLPHTTAVPRSNETSTAGT